LIEELAACIKKRIDMKMKDACINTDGTEVRCEVPQVPIPQPRGKQRQANDDKRVLVGRQPNVG